MNARVQIASSCDSSVKHLCILFGREYYLMEGAPVECNSKSNAHIWLYVIGTGMCAVIVVTVKQFGFV